MHLANILLLAGALVAAHPSSHAHLHRHAHSARDAGKKLTFMKNVHKKIPIPKPSPPEPPKAPEPKEPKPETPKPEAKGKGKPEYIPFCSEGKGYKKGGLVARDELPKFDKRVTEAQVMYTGNLGMAGGCPWNSNIMAVDPELAPQYQYVQMYTNVASVKYHVLCGNKMGAVPGQLTGMFDVPGQNLLSFYLEPGESKAVVVQSNTQAVCAFAPNQVPKTPFGQYAGTWAEVDFENESNGGWSGADCSSLVAQHYDMDVPGCKICDTITCSTIYPGGVGDNAYTKGMEELDGIGLNCVPGPLTMDIKIGIS